MRKETQLSVLVIALFLPGSLLAREPDFREFGAVQELLRRETASLSRAGLT